MTRRVALGALGSLAVAAAAAFFTLARSSPEERPTAAGRSFAKARVEMVRTQIAGRGVDAPRVLAAMRNAPRHEFVPAGYRDEAYEDHPLPIGFGQTISQPYIVALMTELAAVDPGDTVLEVGTGSGYQAAILDELAARVYTVEIIPELARRAARTLARLGYDRVDVRTGDGYFGWPRHAPFDAILVTAAPDHVPPPLVRQLKEGGRMVIPVGPTGGYQTLWRITKRRGKVTSENVTGVIFVPLLRERPRRP